MGPLHQGGDHVRGRAGSRPPTPAAPYLAIGRPLLGFSHPLVDVEHAGDVQPDAVQIAANDCPQPEQARLAGFTDLKGREHGAACVALSQEALASKGPSSPSMPDHRRSPRTFPLAALLPLEANHSHRSRSTPARSATEGPRCCGRSCARRSPSQWRACPGWPRAQVRPPPPPDAASSYEPGAAGPAAATSSCGSGARPATLPRTDGATGQEKDRRNPTEEHAVKQKPPSSATMSRGFQARVISSRDWTTPDPLRDQDPSWGPQAA